MRFYVAVDSKRSGDGSKASPFRYIGEAAMLAHAGDEVIVMPGVYREHVNPIFGGGSDEKRITYRAEIPGTVTITGAEEMKNWVLYRGNVWKASVPNEMFRDYNPYETVVSGDWFIPTKKLHTGDVYLNGKSMYEAQTLEEVLDPKPYAPSWDRGFSVYQWFAQVEEAVTVIYANFQGQDPNENMVEINIRRNCFYPAKSGVNYITVSGFILKQAATTWAPPTAYQEGLIGPHWSKGWIIEDCEISDSKCCGISLGKCLQPNNDNKWVTKGYKVGAQNERDVVCQAWQDGWNKENIGSHIVRRCNIHHCEQAGIVGHLGCIFSIIEDNHIHHINNKQQLNGAEIAGIKLHAAIDTQIRRNHIHHCTRGMWLDWQAQGTRVFGNLFHHNVTPEDAEIFYRLGTGEDLFVEVSHGPTLIDNNLLLSEFSCRLSTQGLAFIHNLIGGSFTMIGKGTNNGLIGNNPRFTPYHAPHGTAVNGFMTILHGDARFYNNIFVQNHCDYSRFQCLTQYGPDVNTIAGTLPYEEYPSREEYFAVFEDGNCYDISRYYSKLPVWTGGNVYFNGAQPCSKEKECCVDTEHTVRIDVVEENDGFKLSTNLYSLLPAMQLRQYSSKDLGEAFEPEQRFENPDGTDIVFNLDYFGATREENPLPGPFEVESIDKLQDNVALYQL